MATAAVPSMDGWIDAAPFRAHVKHLMAVGGLSSSDVAVLVGISPRLAHRLVHGRGGRPLRRVNPDNARRLLQVSSADARAVRRRTVPAGSTVQHMEQLRRAGWSDPDLARLLDLTATQLADLLSGREGSCSQLVALRAAAAAPWPGATVPPAPARAQPAA